MRDYCDCSDPWPSLESLPHANLLPLLNRSHLLDVCHYLRDQLAHRRPFDHHRLLHLHQYLPPGHRCCGRNLQATLLHQLSSVALVDFSTVPSQAASRRLLPKLHFHQRPSDRATSTFVQRIAATFKSDHPLCRPVASVDMDPSH